MSSQMFTRFGSPGNAIITSADKLTEQMLMCELELGSRTTKHLAMSILCPEGEQDDVWFWWGRATKTPPGRRCFCQKESHMVIIDGKGGGFHRSPAFPQPHLE